MLLKLLFLGSLTPYLIKADVNVRFWLYSNQNPATPISTSDYGNIEYNPDFRYVILCHGYQEDSTNAWYQQIINAFMQKSNYIVITTDYKDAVNGLLIPDAENNVPIIASQIGDLIIGLNQVQGIPAFQFEVVGASLGGQVVGDVGFYTKAHGVLVYRIFGLDPAGPGYEGTTNGLHEDAAYRTIAIHTSVVGVRNRVAYFDFYPNDGITQGFCGLLHFGDHYTSTYYFIESILRNQFIGKICDNFVNYINHKCDSNPSNPMGYGALDNAPPGAYYLVPNCL